MAVLALVLTVAAGDGGGGARRGRQGGTAALSLAALGGERHAAPRQTPQGALDRQQAHVLWAPRLLSRHRRGPAQLACCRLGRGQAPGATRRPIRVVAVAASNPDPESDH